MPAKRELTMRQIRQMLRLAHDGVSAREIGRTLRAARSTIQDNLNRARTAGLSWPLPGDLTDDVLEQRLFARAGARRGFRRRAEPDWASLACELKRPGVNLTVLWEEFAEDPVAQWNPHALEQLNWLHHWTVQVFLGTNELEHPGVTLSNFHWRAVASDSF